MIQRKVLTPNDFSSLADLEPRPLAFEHHYQEAATPFKWTFTRHDMVTAPPNAYPPTTTQSFPAA